MRKEEKLKRNCLRLISAELRFKLIKAKLPTKGYDLKAKINWLLSYWEKHSQGKHWANRRKRQS
jgi:hypothetical protein